MGEVLPPEQADDVADQPVQPRRYPARSPDQLALGGIRRHGTIAWPTSSGAHHGPAITSRSSISTNRVVIQCRRTSGRRRRDDRDFVNGMMAIRRLCLGRERLFYRLCAASLPPHLLAGIALLALMSVIGPRSCDRGVDVRSPSRRPTNLFFACTGPRLPWRPASHRRFIGYTAYLLACSKARYATC